MTTRAALARILALSDAPTHDRRPPEPKSCGRSDDTLRSALRANGGDLRATARALGYRGGETHMRRRLHRMGLVT